jgi:hypothetical protein
MPRVSDRHCAIQWIGKKLKNETSNAKQYKEAWLSQENI